MNSLRMLYKVEYIVFHVDREQTAAATYREKINELNKHNWDCTLGARRTLVEQVKYV